ncbi:exodeoxyribonuclease V subunit alpha [Nocardioides panaciterrulae]|uniref:RecBCD enzyme subunit RecD n=1 Tax=Nocardioides panaciterrulae TaxID=661492 RepID=A0A7Y9JC96_9ACTN|nr:exodeoxyribonuclease V subunit alpha [Nocardioides panaciterrulae]NYD43765.1 exodeoxyribonuclease V alpha subunit [Nocardioides panaciterrulae]
MTELFEPAGEHDARLVLGADGLLGDLNRGGVLEAPDVHVARRLGELGGESDERVLAAVGLAVRAVRHGSVCVDLATVPQVAPALGWPEPAAWQAAVAGSPLLEAGAVRLEHGLLYLDRYHRLEEQVVADLRERAAQPPPVVDEPALAAAVARVRGGHLSSEQEEAAVRAVRRWTTVLTGGPGTGKTTTVARMLALVADQAAGAGRPLSIALSAPTGKAAARLQEAVLGELAGLPDRDRDQVGRVEAMTLHRLLGWLPDNTTRFRHDRGNRLKYDLVVVDESSMVELTMMARLLEAVRPQARLVLVGDPRQLTSVGAGAVLSDLVAGYDGQPDSPVVSLTHNYRSTEDIKALAEALRVGDADGVLAALRTDSPEVEFVETEDAAPVLREGLVHHALRVRQAAESGDARAATEVLDEHRLLCAHREGPHGVRHWNRLVEQWLGEETGVEIHSEWYAGRPLLVTANDYAVNVYNGETGVTVRRPDGRLRAVIAGSGGLLDLAPGRLDAIDTMHAMTIHKSQGSQAEEVTVLLPAADSRLLTRELFYTAVTRARSRLRVVGTEEAVRAAVAAQAQRATGLRQRLTDRRA